PDLNFGHGQNFRSEVSNLNLQFVGTCRHIAFSNEIRKNNVGVELVEQDIVVRLVQDRRKLEAGIAQRNEAGQHGGLLLAVPEKQFALELGRSLTLQF